MKKEKSPYNFELTYGGFLLLYMYLLLYVYECCMVRSHEQKNLSKVNGKSNLKIAFNLKKITCIHTQYVNAPYTWFWPVKSYDFDKGLIRKIIAMFRIFHKNIESNS